MKKVITCLAVCLMVVSGNLTNAQTLKVDRMVYAWENMRNMVVNSVEKLPAKDWNFAADDSVRNFEEQVKHIATSNRFFPGSLAGKRDELQAMNQKTGTLKSKKEIIADLNQSFDFAIASIREITDWDQVIDAFGNKVSKLELILQAEHHLHREHGKLIVLLRMNDIPPARSTSWFK